MQQLEIEKIKSVLKRYKLPFSSYELVNSPEKAAKIAKRLKFPVVMKIASSDILHKSDVGGVKTGLKDEEEVKQAYAEMMKSVKKKSPKAKIKGVYMQKMEQGVEVIVGMKRDEQFGPVLVFGLGGIFVEIMKDTSLRIAPINRNQALEMIKEVKSYPVLHGARGRNPVNINALADIIVKTSRLSSNKKIAELDFNPIMANERSARIVDARIITE